MQNGRMTMRVLCLRVMAVAFDISLASGPLQDTRDVGKDLFAFLDAEVFDEFYLLFSSLSGLTLNRRGILTDLIKPRSRQS